MYARRWLKCTDGSSLCRLWTLRRQALAGNMGALPPTQISVPACSATFELVIFDVKFDGGLLVAIAPTLKLLCTPKYRVFVRQSMTRSLHEHSAFGFAKTHVQVGQDIVCNSLKITSTR